MDRKINDQPEVRNYKHFHRLCIFRFNLGMFNYSHSRIFRYVFESMAQVHHTHDIWQGSATGNVKILSLKLTWLYSNGLLHVVKTATTL